MYLKGKYKLEKVLGEGGMGVVYLATNIENNELVAVKQILSLEELEIHDEKEVLEAIKRFQREYFFLARIKHPNVVQVYDFIEEKEKNGLFIVLEYVSGISLENMVMGSPRKLSLREQLAIASQSARAVEVLNTAGVIHRDIKPANIMVDEETKSVKLLDLGISRLLSNDMTKLTAAGETIGTPEYMSPEQVRGEISPTSDIFSLGVTLYQFFLWDTESPFNTDNVVSTMEQVLFHSLTPLTNVLKNIRSEEREAFQAVSQVLDRATEKDPKKRTQSAGEMADEFDRICRSLFSRSEQSLTRIKSWKPSIRLSPSELQHLRQLRDKYSSNVELGNESAEQSAKTYYDNGVSFFLGKNLAKALENFSQAIEIHPQYAEAYQYRGIVYKTVGKIDHALRDWNKAIAIHPRFVTAYYNRGLTRCARGDLSGAIEDYNQAIRYNPNYAAAYYNRANVLCKKGQLKRAWQDYNAAIRINPKYAAAYNNRGNVRYKCKDIKGALADYEKALELRPDLTYAQKFRDYILKNYSQQLRK